MPLRSQLEDMFALADSPIWMDSSTAANAGSGKPRWAARRPWPSYGFRATSGSPATRSPGSADAAGRLRGDGADRAGQFVHGFAAGRDYVRAIDRERRLGHEPDGHSQSEMVGRRPGLHGPGACAPGWATPVPSHTVFGALASVLRQRFGFNADCRLVAFSGDNPNSLAGCCL